MKTRLITLLAISFAATIAQSQALPTINSALDSALRAYISTHQQTPEQYILSKFTDHDIVFLGENHKIRQDLLLVHRLIPLLYNHGVYTLCTEFAGAREQPLIDSLLNSPTYDESLARLIQFRHYVLWPFHEYVDVYKIAWQLNQSLHTGQRRFRILGVNSSVDWSYIKKPEDLNDGRIMLKVWGLSVDDTEVERHWANVILENVVSKGEKALVYSGIHHAFTQYRQPIVVDGKFSRWGDMRMGNWVFNKIGKRAITIALHAPWYNPQFKSDLFPADGYIDAFFLYGTSKLYPIGFDTKDSPFGKLPGDSSYYKFGYDKFTLETFCDAYVYLCPFDECEPVSIIPDFVNASNIDVARNQTPDPAFRTATIEDFHKAAIDATVGMISKFPKTK